MFDETDKRNFVFFGQLHVKPAARIVSLSLLCIVFMNLFVSLGQSAAVMLSLWMSACFSIGIYGALVYAVFKEKRMFMLPYLIFQVKLYFFSLKNGFCIKNMKLDEMSQKCCGVSILIFKY